jgi:hypothetical protein
MRYRAYYGTSGSDRVSPLDKGQSPFREFSDLDQALQWANQVARKGTSVLAIDGDDGTQLTKNEIAVAIASRYRSQPSVNTG